MEKLCVVMKEESISETFYYRHSRRIASVSYSVYPITFFISNILQLYDSNKGKTPVRHAAIADSSPINRINVDFLII